MILNLIVIPSFGDNLETLNNFSIPNLDALSIYGYQIQDKECETLTKWPNIKYGPITSINRIRANSNEFVNGWLHLEGEEPIQAKV